MPVMPFSGKNLEALINGANSMSESAARSGAASQMQAQKLQAEKEQLAQKAALEQEAQNAEQARKEEAIARLLGNPSYKPYLQEGFSSGDLRLGGEHDPRKGVMGIQLTPAQEAAEKSAGKRISDWEVGGGLPAAEKNIQALEDVQEELESGKRDWYDRTVGSVAGKSPSLFGLIGPTEKARTDRARSTAITLAKQTDPNPTQQTIDMILSQTYDPASTDKENADRIRRYVTQERGRAQQMKDSSDRMRKTGYAIVGSKTPASTRSKRPEDMTDAELDAELSK